MREEYSRALARSHDADDAVQLIPVLLRDVELPGFLANRNWVDFRDASSFDQSLDKLIWGVTGKKPKASPAQPLKRRARQSSLSELLVSVADKRDAWRRFLEPVELVGRDGELERLADFASAEEPFVWQVLYGPHAVGKSRLALEWLRRLGRLDARWTVGVFQTGLQTSNVYSLCRR